MRSQEKDETTREAGCKHLVVNMCWLFTGLYSLGSLDPRVQVCKESWGPVVVRPIPPHRPAALFLQDTCAKWFSEEALLLIPKGRPASSFSTQVSFRGRINPGAQTCWISYPGKYAAAWLSAASNEGAQDSIACVFLAETDDGPGPGYFPGKSSKALRAVVDVCFGYQSFTRTPSIHTVCGQNAILCVCV